MPLIVILLASLNAGYLGFTAQSTPYLSYGQLKANLVGWYFAKFTFSLQ